MGRATIMPSGGLAPAGCSISAPSTIRQGFQPPMRQAETAQSWSAKAQYRRIQNSFFSHAFRWTSSGGMVDLGTLGNVAGYSAATATNLDGSVVVGRSTASTDPSGGSAIHAFRWTSSAGMADLGTPGGAPGNSRATGVSGDGGIVIGQYSGNCTECGELPFRWTEKTGTQDLNSLLKSAGVLPAGTLLYSANGISSDGQFIVGSAKFDSDPAYIVRYFDGAGRTIAALTTTNSLYILSISYPLPA